ncbi:PaaX family transcriptional regulator [Streptantibioticus ferralitis]|uniref:PaaX family transcriptional regulator C-terminal domain-containing protein n=1 Tax=Streptantibioticus ferralitis TaxID=236510 RepID=A0ABT5Z4J0_9ACTN|nr:PaaX family transcriptional regulator C-terminal domain-containing protein [Streptantibioticus ferralitis]MDF2258742.1 PaaX family transcriptional regulator C-terminal domain-containing protein [Streptantibioticus ferralitis]
MEGQRAEGHTPSSLIVTFFGAYGRAECDGRVPVAALIRLLGAADVDPQSVRSAVSRLKRRGLLVADRVGGAAAYRLSPDATELLADGDRRIYRGAPVPAADDWVLAVFSVPESERHKRHLLRSRLARLGFGTAAPGVWIAPAQVYAEARHTLERLGLASYVDLFRGAHLGFEPTRQAVRRWWDLDAIAALHRAFLEAQEPVLAAWSGRSSVRPEDAFRDYLRALDSWRRLPYADPGLPAELLPADWPGGRAAQVFTELHDRLREPGAEFVRAVHRMT